jgi:hypothetical protein
MGYHECAKYTEINNEKIAILTGIDSAGVALALAMQGPAAGGSDSAGGSAEQKLKAMQDRTHHAVDSLLRARKKVRTQQVKALASNKGKARGPYKMSTAMTNRSDAQTGKARGPYKMNTSGTTKAVPKPANPTHVKSGTGGILAWKVRSCYLLHRVPMCVGTEHSIALCPVLFLPFHQSQKYALGRFKEYAQRMKCAPGMKGCNEFIHSVGPKQFETWAFNASDGTHDAASACKGLKRKVASVMPKAGGRW